MNKKLGLVVSFDTTGSMYPVLSQARQQVEKDLVKDKTEEKIDETEKPIEEPRYVWVDEFEELESTDVKVIIEAEVEKVVSKEKLDKQEVKKEKAENKVIVKLEKSIAKVTDGLGRYEISKRQRNKTYLTNNLSKVIKEAQELLDSLNK